MRAAFQLILEPLIPRADAPILLPTLLPLLSPKAWVGAEQLLMSRCQCCLSLSLPHKGGGGGGGQKVLFQGAGAWPSQPSQPTEGM